MLELLEGEKGDEVLETVTRVGASYSGQHDTHSLSAAEGVPIFNRAFCICAMVEADEIS